MRDAVDDRPRRHARSSSARARRYSGLCPFHGSAARQQIDPNEALPLFRLQGHGDCFTFVQELEGLTSPALEFLAERYNVARGGRRRPARSREAPATPPLELLERGVLRECCGVRRGRIPHLVERPARPILREFRGLRAERVGQAKTARGARATPRTSSPPPGSCHARENGRVYDRHRRIGVPAV